MPWTVVADADEIEEEDVIEVSLGDRVLAIYHTKDGYFATDGICTHEHARLAEGFVFGSIIECPKHQGRFDVRSGECKGSPVSVPVHTYPTRIVDGTVEVNLGDASPGVDREQSGSER
jgi:3-phenylpropionate/trans-cinnamate dioxygenase ferredoxin subunit